MPRGQKESRSQGASIFVIKFVNVPRGRVEEQGAKEVHVRSQGANCLEFMIGPRGRVKEQRAKEVCVRSQGVDHHHVHRCAKGRRRFIVFIIVPRGQENESRSQGA